MVTAPSTSAIVYVTAPAPVYTPAPYAAPPPPPAVYAMTLVPAYLPAAAAAVPAYTLAPATLYQGQGRGRRGRGRGGRVRGLKRSLSFAPQPSVVPYNPGGVPPPAQGTQEYAPNPYKRFNNWNMCFSCRFYIPHWHTSTTCPFKDKATHQI